MKILIINPNSDMAMTAAIQAGAEAFIRGRRGDQSRASVGGQASGNAAPSGGSAPGSGISSDDSPPESAAFSAGSAPESAAFSGGSAPDGATGSGGSAPGTATSSGGSGGSDTVDDLRIRTVSTPGAPPFIETHAHEVRCGPGMLEIMEEHEAAFDAFVVACHSDVHLDALRELTAKPVIGIGEASMKLASFLGRTFSVVTTHQHSVPGKLEQIRRYHLQDRVASVRAPEAGEEGLGEVELFLELARRARDEDGAEVVVLGCAGLAGMDRTIQEALDVPVLDGVVCALILATGFVRHGLGTSKVLYYDPEY